MFHIQDPRYELYAARAVGEYLVEWCVARAFGVGSAVRSQAAHQTPCAPPPLQKHASSKSTSYVLKQCRQLLDQQRELQTSSNPTDHPPISADATLRAQRSQVLIRLLDQLVASEDAPSVKLGHLHEMISDSVNCDDSDWAFTLSLLSARLGLCKLEFGDWAEAVAHAELDLATCYVMLHNFEMASAHCDSCAVVLQNIVRAPHSDSTAVWLAAKNDFVAAASRSMIKSAKGAVKRIARAAAQICPQKNESSFACRLVELCCLVATNRDTQEHHQQVRDAIAAAMAVSFSAEHVLWTYCALLQIHLSILATVDSELRALGIPEVKQKLAEEVTHAPSKKDLDELSVKLKTTLTVLSEKSNALQLCIVRQVDCIHQLFSRLFETMIAMGPLTSTMTIGYANLLRYAWLRCLAVGLRRHDCEQLASSAVEGLIQSFHARHMIVACSFVDVGCAISENDLIRIVELVSVRDLRRFMHQQQQTHNRKSVKSEDDVVLPEKKSLSAGADESCFDDDDASRMHTLRRSVEHYERGAQLLIALAGHSFSSWPILSMSLRQMTVILHRIQDTKSEILWLSILAALSAETLGPTHAETELALRLVAGKQRRVHAPLFHPSWGVQQLMTHVTIGCDTSGADVMFCVADEARGQASSAAFVRYTAPIQLDRIGRVCIRAYASKDGLHSGVVEARFSVVHRSEK